MKKEVMFLNDAELMKVCGGDFGDIDDDTNASESMYETGKSVAVYNTFFHVAKVNQIITECKWNGSNWEYKYTDYRDGKEKWITADDIAN